jgi:hypothetical protein
VFGRARWRLTLWFAGALTLIIVVIGRRRLLLRSPDAVRPGER